MQEKQPQLQPIKHLPTLQFLRKFTMNLFIGFAIIAGSLFLGMLGYHHFEKMSWVDAYVNASMILSGMGPVKTLNTEAGKTFCRHICFL